MEAAFKIIFRASIIQLSNKHYIFIKLMLIRSRRPTEIPRVSVNVQRYLQVQVVFFLILILAASHGFTRRSFPPVLRS